MASDLKYERVPAAWGGIDSDSAPDQLESKHAPLVENFLVNRPSKLTMRGSVGTAALPSTVDADKVKMGILANGDQNTVIYASLALTGTVGVPIAKIVEPWMVPIKKPNAASALIEADTAGSTGAVFVRLTPPTDGITDVETDDTSAISASRVRAPGPVVDKHGTYEYWIGFDGGGTTVTKQSSVYPLTQISSGQDTGSIVDYTNGPKGAYALKWHAQRLFVLGGRNPDGSGTIEPNTLWYSDPHPTDSQLPSTLAAWQDNSSGLVNRIDIPNSNALDYGLGLASVNGLLVILRRESLFVMHGHSPSSFTVRQFSSAVGLVDPRALCEIEEGCVFMSQRGLMFFDGSELFSLSDGTIYSELRDAMRQALDPAIDGGYVTVHALDDGYVFVSMGYHKFSTGATLKIFEAYCHVPTRSWAKFSSTRIGQVYLFGRSNEHILCLGPTTGGQFRSLTKPEDLPHSLRGADWDSGSGAAAIPAKWHSRLTRLGTPTHRSQMHRFFLDYAFQVDGAADDANNGWYVTLVNGNGDTILAETQVPAQGEPGSYLYRRRYVVSVVTEATDVQVRVEWKTSALALVKADIYDAGIEYQEANQRRSS